MLHMVNRYGARMACSAVSTGVGSKPARAGGRGVHDALAGSQGRSGLARGRAARESGERTTDEKWHNPSSISRSCICHCRHASPIDNCSMGGLKRVAEEIITHHGNGCPSDNVTCKTVLDQSKHSDGTIFRGEHDWHVAYRIADRHETCLEPMSLSDPTNCRPDRNNCKEHIPCPMMQIFSLMLAYTKLDVDDGPIQIYGYLAVRDLLEPLINYVFHRSRDDPLFLDLEQGSIIQMTGPKRGIDMQSGVLLEFDMKIKQGEQESEDLQLIDGASYFSELTPTPCKVFTARIVGDYGAVEATIDVGISQADDDSNVNLSLTSVASGLPKEIHLFRGMMSSGARRFVVAVVSGTMLELKFKMCQTRSEDGIDRSCSFKATEHGCTSEDIILEFATISVKVHWSTLEDSG